MKLFGIKEYLLPPPSKIWSEFLKRHPTVFSAAWVTTTEIIGGYLLAVVVSIPLALAVVRWRFVEESVYPLVVFLQIIPKIAIAPLFIIWFGFGLFPKLLIVFLLCFFFPIVVASVAGFKAVDPDVMDFARSTGASGMRMFLKIRLPQALPDIFTGLKVGAALSATAAVVAEFVASDRGLGYLLQQYNGQLETPMVFAIIVLLSLIGHRLLRRRDARAPRHPLARLAAAGRRHGGLNAQTIKAPKRRRSLGGEDHEDETEDHRGAARAGGTALHRSRSGTAQDAVSLRLNWYLGGLHVPFYYGVEKGFYNNAEGINLTINEGRGSANTVQVVAAGTDTFGLADSSSVINLISKGGEIKSVMNVLSSTGFSVVSLASTGIKTPKDLEGKSLAVSPGDPAPRPVRGAGRPPQARHEQDQLRAGRSRRQGRDRAGEARRRAPRRRDDQYS